MTVTIKRSKSNQTKASIALKVLVSFDPEDDAALQEACHRMGDMIKATGISGDELATLLATLEIETANLAAEAKA